MTEKRKKVRRTINEIADGITIEEARKMRGGRYL